MGIQLLETPATETNAGIFNLPPEFDRSAHAAKWVKVGKTVAIAQQREHILGTRYTADAWEVWRDPQEQTCIVATSDGEYILMFRPIEIQQQVNAIYGNVGKQRLTSELKGETILGEQNMDSGMLPDSALRHVDGDFGSQDSGVPLNSLETAPTDRIRAKTIKTKGKAKAEPET